MRKQFDMMGKEMNGKFSREQEMETLRLKNTVLIMANFGLVVLLAFVILFKK